MHGPGRFVSPGFFVKAMTKDRGAPTALDSLELLEMARLDYLYGVEGEPPLRSTSALAARYRLRHSDVQKHAEVWYKELEIQAERLTKLFDNTFTQQTIDSHEDDVLFLRRQMDLIKQRIQATDPTMVGMETHQFLTKQFLDLSKRWCSLSGIDVAQATVKNAHSSIIKKIMEEMADRSKQRGGDNTRRVEGAVFDVEG